MSASSLFGALRKGDAAAVRIALVRSESLVTAKDQQGRTPLHVACLQGSLEAVKEIVKYKGAMIDATDNSGNTPLHYAAEQGSVPIVNELLHAANSKRLLLKRRNKLSQTPLHVAVLGGHAGVVAAFMDAGARNADAKDGDGQLPSALIPPDCPDAQLIREMLTSSTDGPGASPASVAHTVPAPASRSSSGRVSHTGLTLATHVAASLAASTPPGPASARPASAREGPPAGGRTMSAAPLSARPAGRLPVTREASVPARPSPSPPPPLRGVLEGTPTPGVPRGALSARGNPPTIGITPRGTTRSSGGGSVLSSGHGSTTPGPSAATAQALADLRTQLEAYSARAEAAEARSQALSGLLAEAQATLHAQSERLGVVESCLAGLDDRGRELRNRVDRADDVAREARAKDQEQRVAQDGLIRGLATRVHTLQSGHEGLQAAVQQLSGDVTRLVTTGPTAGVAAASSRAQGPDATSPQFATLHAQVTELSGQVATLSARGAELDSLRTRVAQMEALGVSDQLEVLQLRTQKLSTSVAQLAAEQAVAGEQLAATTGKLAGLSPTVSTPMPSTGVNGGKGSGSGAGIETGSHTPGAAAAHPAGAQHANGAKDRSSAPAAMALGGRPQAGTRGSGGGDAPGGSDIAALRDQVAALQHQVAHLASAAGVPAPPTPPATPHSTGAPSAASNRRGGGGLGAGGGGAGGPSASEFAEVRRELSQLKDRVEALSGEVGGALGTLRREWDEAVRAAAARHVERSAELAQREARVKAMRDAVMGTEETRAGLATLEKRVLSSLAGIDTRLGLLQHKVEVVEYQMLQAGDGEGSPPAPAPTPLPAGRGPRSAGQQPSLNALPAHAVASPVVGARKGPVAEDIARPATQLGSPIAGHIAARMSPAKHGCSAELESRFVAQGSGVTVQAPAQQGVTSVQQDMQGVSRQENVHGGQRQVWVESQEGAAPGSGVQAGIRGQEQPQEPKCGVCVVQ